MTLHRYTFRAMAAENEIQVHGPDAAKVEAASRSAIEEILRIEAKYSRYREESVVCAINAAAGQRAVSIDAETAHLLDFADACYRQSDGAFDATSGVLRRVWNFKVARVPTESEIARVLPLIGWERVERDAYRVRLPLAGMELDFGGFGKEYAVDRAAAVLRERGIESAFVNLAGDLAILGEQPGGVPWQLGIRHPREDAGIIAKLPVASGGVATSGDYERFIEVDGVRHCHILDPGTGHSVQGLQSVTVHATSCIVAGATSTIAMLKGRETGEAWLRAMDLAFFCVRDDGSVVHTFG